MPPVESCYPSPRGTLKTTTSVPGAMTWKMKKQRSPAMEGTAILIQSILPCTTTLLDNTEKEGFCEWKQPYICILSSYLHLYLIISQHVDKHSALESNTFVRS